MDFEGAGTVGVGTGDICRPWFRRPSSTPYCSSAVSHRVQWLAVPDRRHALRRHVVHGGNDGLLRGLGETVYLRQYVVVLVTPKPKKTDGEKTSCISIGIEQTILTDKEAQLLPNKPLHVGLMVCIIIISCLVHYASCRISGVRFIKIIVFVTKHLELNNYDQ